MIIYLKILIKTVDLLTFFRFQQGKDGKMSKDGVMAALAPYKAEDEGLYNKLVKLLTEDCMPQGTFLHFDFKTTRNLFSSNNMLL